MKRIIPYLVIITFIWLGFVLAISFMEAPLKFKAPSVTMAIGVDIGRLVFGALNKVEIVFSLAYLFGIRYYYIIEKRIGYIMLVILVIVLIQTVYLLPVLDKYALLVISGKESPSSIPHIVYVVFEIGKIVLLALIGYKQLLVFRNVGKKRIYQH
ncbi:hypothetical protein ACFSTE_16750 [Aquimarina hainanensis]|uniref:DUF4149 domain-containing protein n=1 Tax=Aquimarina hainanensis TaxID=1578017 RepID=A0ABW5NBW4_9FLAO|nr:hypothetical protein [Aquimarina sp. TRL1]QKX07004.1 hypothetical protein HN014_19480 [Aquimarina sp. TRL1]